MRSTNFDPQHLTISREIYLDFYKAMIRHLQKDSKGITVEFGCGLGLAKEIHPSILLTDLFQNPWVDRIENVYSSHFNDAELSNVLLLDVFHHLQYPGSALKEMWRILKPKGRLILLEPCMSLLGCLVYGVFHHEPLGLGQSIAWEIPEGTRPSELNYFAAQARASKVFFDSAFKEKLRDWNILMREKKSYLHYPLSGGFSKPQILPTRFLNTLKNIGPFFDLFPILFATRLLVVLEKP